MEKKESSTRWYFLTIGWAMANEVFQSLCHHEEFKLVPANGAKPKDKILVRYYRHYLDIDSDSPPYYPEDAEKLGLQFHGYRFPLDPKSSPEEIRELNSAYNSIRCFHTPESSRAVIVERTSGTTIMVILANSSFDTIMRGFQELLNQRYMEQGAIPNVNLFYTDDIDSAKNLLGLYRIQETSPEFENRFKTWCYEMNVDFKNFQA